MKNCDTEILKGQIVKLEEKHFIFSCEFIDIKKYGELDFVPFTKDGIKIKYGKLITNLSKIKSKLPSQILLPYKYQHIECEVTFKLNTISKTTAIGQIKSRSLSIILEKIL